MVDALLGMVWDDSMNACSMCYDLQNATGMRICKCQEKPLLRRLPVLKVFVADLMSLILVFLSGERRKTSVVTRLTILITLK